MEASRLQPMRLLRIPEPFDHPDRLYEVKFDRFRALAHVGHHCQLVSRNGHPFKSWRYLAKKSRTRYARTKRRWMGRSSASTLTDAVASVISCSVAIGRSSWRSTDLLRSQVCRSSEEILDVHEQ